MTTLRSEDPAPYGAHRCPDADHDDQVIAHALAILQARLCKSEVMSDPKAVRDFLRLHYAADPESVHRESFGVMYLDAQNRLIANETAFTGTLTQTSVYPREILRRVLHHGAAAVVFHHNHPSGSDEPSRADEYLTQTLKSALALIDVRTLDHFVVGAASVVSFAERGLL
jgi:DNA repair protein RadC